MTQPAFEGERTDEADLTSAMSDVLDHRPWVSLEPGAEVRKIYTSAAGIGYLGLKQTRLESDPDSLENIIEIYDPSGPPEGTVKWKKDDKDVDLSLPKRLFKLEDEAG